MNNKKIKLKTIDINVENYTNNTNNTNSKLDNTDILDNNDEISNEENIKINKINKYNELRNYFKDDNIFIIIHKLYDVFYSINNKLPLLVVEEHNKFKNLEKTQNLLLKKDKKMNYPYFSNNININSDNLFLDDKDYINLLTQGGALKHHATTDNYNDNENYYLDAFDISNTSIIDIVLKTGLLYLLDYWIKTLYNDKTLKNIKIYSGSIPSKENININGKKINIPAYFYKIITCEDNNKQKYNNLIYNQNHNQNNNQNNNQNHNQNNNFINDFLYINNNTQNNSNFYCVCFLIPNVRPDERIYKLYKYIVELNDIINLTNIDFYNIFKYYTDYNDFKRINNLRYRVRIDIHLNDYPILIKKIKGSFFYGLLVDSKNLSELENNWRLCCTKGFSNRGHEYYYNLLKKKMMSTNNNKINIKKLINNNYDTKNNIFKDRDKTKKKIIFKKNSLKKKIF